MLGPELPCAQSSWAVSARPLRGKPGGFFFVFSWLLTRKVGSLSEVSALTVGHLRLFGEMK